MGLEQTDRTDKLSEVVLNPSKVQHDALEQPPASTAEGIQGQLAAVQAEISKVVNGALTGSGFQTAGLDARVGEMAKAEGVQPEAFIKQAITENPQQLAALNQQVS